MASVLRDRILGSSKRLLLGGSKRHEEFQAPMQYQPQPVYPVEDLPSPFGELGLNLSESELRETAYEILVAACRSTGTRPLTYISQSDKADRTPSLTSSASLQRSLTSSAASRVKKALGLKSASSKRNGGNDSVSQGRAKKAVTTGELMRLQMRVSEQTDSRIRRALLRVAAGQLGRRIESMVLPLELLQQFKSSDFPNPQEFEAWQRRNLKVLEAGLLLHPHLPLERTDTAAQRLRQIIRGALEKPLETGKHSESMQALRNVVMSLAGRSLEGTASDTCHWADGYPLNLRLYQVLLDACFDISEETTIIEEVDEVLELIKKTWVILGLDQKLHNLCFSWVLFQRYVVTGQVESDLLFASNNLMIEVEKDANAMTDPVDSKVLSSTLSLVLGWAEKKLIAYRAAFHGGNVESMQSVVSLGVLSAKILVEDISHEYRKKRKEANVACERVEAYIRSSLRTAFAQKMEKVNSSKHSSKKQNSSLPALSVLAQETSELALSEKEIFSPIMKRWHPLAAGVAVATLHSCYGNELKQFLTSITELTPDTVRVLRSADKLEKDLVQIAVEDAVDSEDGGKSIIQQMPPYEAEAVIADLVRSWIKTRVDRLKEWTDRNLQQECEIEKDMTIHTQKHGHIPVTLQWHHHYACIDSLLDHMQRSIVEKCMMRKQVTNLRVGSDISVWNPRANKERFAPSAVEVLRIIDETLEAFFMLPIPNHPVLLPELMTGFDRCLQHYVMKAKSGCGTRSTYVPVLPALTRCSTGSKFHGVFKKKEKSQITQKRKSQVATSNGNDSFGIPQLCVRLNTLKQIRTELGVLEKRTVAHLENAECSSHGDNIANGTGKRFDLSATACAEGIQQLCEAIAYKIIFHELTHVLWDALYVGEVPSSRIEPFLQELEQYLEIISSTVHDRVRTRVITDVMKASFDGFLLVLLAGGPSRGFTQQDSEIIKEDFKLLTDLFWSNGDGLPADLIDKFSTTVKRILPLLSTPTESLIEQFRRLVLEAYGSAAKSKLPLPPTSGQWDPTEPNTILRVLCHRNGEAAAKFLKKTYNLPKKL